MQSLISALKVLALRTNPNQNRLFPENILSIIKWTPIPYLVDLPVSIATGLIDGTNWLPDIFFACIWCIVLTILSLIIYKFGIKNYEAFGQ